MARTGILIKQQAARFETYLPDYKVGTIIDVNTL